MGARRPHRRALVVALATLALVATAGVVVTGTTDPLRDGAPMASDAAPTAADLGSATLRVAGNAFHAEDSTATVAVTADGCIDIGAGDVVAVGLDVPHGATVTAIAAHVHDDGSGGDVVVALERYTVPTSGAPTTTTVFTVSSANGDDSGHQHLADTTPMPDADAATIDLDDHAYSLVARGGAGAPDLCSVSVTHTRPAADGLVLHPTEPCAVLDTRPGQGGPGTPVPAGGTLTVDIIAADHSAQGGVADTSACPVPPASGATITDGTEAVLVHLVVVNPTSGGNLRVWDADLGDPAGGSLVFSPGDTAGNVLTVGVGSSGPDSDGGEIVVRNNGPDPVHVRAVLLGWYRSVDPVLE